MPYASATRLASGALRASRPSARTSSTTPRTGAWSRVVPVRSCVVVEAIYLPLLGCLRSVRRAVRGAAARSDRAGLGELLHLVALVLEELLEDLAVVLAQERRAADLDGRVGQ